MKKYLIVIIAFFTFCSNDTNVAADLSELEKDIAQTEERIDALISKDSLTFEEEQELENLEEQFEELEEGHDDHDEEGHDDHDEEGHDEEETEEDSSVVEEETTTTTNIISVYDKGEIIDTVGTGSNFYKREVTINGVRIVATGNVGGQQAVPDTFLSLIHI